MKEVICLRPHHGMCLAYFRGEGYSEGFYRPHGFGKGGAGGGSVDPGDGIGGSDLPRLPQPPGNGLPDPREGLPV